MEFAALALVIGVFILGLGLLPEEEITFTIRLTGLLLVYLAGAWVVYSLALGILVAAGILPAHGV
jgi:hypothetical protein